MVACGFPAQCSVPVLPLLSHLTGAEMVTPGFHEEGDIHTLDQSGEMLPHHNYASQATPPGAAQQLKVGLGNGPSLRRFEKAHMWWV